MTPFTYERATSPAHAAAAVAARPGARFIAGGTNLLDLMKLQIEAPMHLVDVNGAGMGTVEPTAQGGLRIGAMVRNSDLAAHPRVRRDYGVLTRALVAGASGQLRNMATTGVTCCSAHGVRTSTTPTCPATSGGLAAAARPSAG